jgi:hypothetical protein
VPVVGKPLQLVSESINNTPQVHASFRAAPNRLTNQTNNSRLNAASASVAFQIPVVGREPMMRGAIDGEVRAVEVIVAVEVTGLVDGVTEFGFSVHVEPAGAPVQVSATAVV